VFVSCVCVCVSHSSVCLLRSVCVGFLLAA
jgi:hypothetical protein